MIRILRWILGVGLCLLFCGGGLGLLSIMLLMGGIAAPVQTVYHLATGWCTFPQRTLSQATVDGPAIATGLLALALFAGLLHGCCGWLAAERRRLAEGATANDHRPWPVRRTAAIVGVAITLFVSGLAMVGLTQQVGWLFASPEPLTEFKGSPPDTAEAAYRWSRVGWGLRAHHEAHGAFPAGATVDPHGRLLHGWQTALLPYIGQQERFDQIDPSRPWNDPVHAPAFCAAIDEYSNPALRDEPRHDAAGFALSDIAGNVHVLGGQRPWRLDDITDGAAHTMLAGEVVEGRRPWGEPRNWRDPLLGINRSPEGFGGPWRRDTMGSGLPPGMQLLMVDGSVRFLAADTDAAVLRALATPDGLTRSPGGS